MGNENSRNITKVPIPRNTPKLENSGNDTLRGDTTACYPNDLADANKKHFQLSSREYDEERKKLPGISGRGTLGPSTEDKNCQSAKVKMEYNSVSERREQDEKSERGFHGQRKIANAAVVTVTKTASKLPSFAQENAGKNSEAILSQFFNTLTVGAREQLGSNSAAITCGDDGEPTNSKKVDDFHPQQVRIGEIIGEGGFGRVFKATLNGTTNVASKLIMAPLVATEDELNMLLTLQHRNFATIMGIVRQSSQMDPPQLLLYYYPEGNVLQFLKNDENPKDNNTLGKFAFDVSEGCQFLHKSNIVHGNLAARNILVDKVVNGNKTYYNAKISDIGIIRFAEPSGGNYVKVPGSENMIVPLRWVPKEIIDGSTPDFTFSSDVWGFGVFLWEMWTMGAIPYGATYSNQRIIQLLNDGYSPLKVHRPTGCPKNIVAAMESAFQVDPNDRPTFTEFMSAFQYFKRYGTVTGSTSEVNVVGSSGVVESAANNKAQPNQKSQKSRDTSVDSKRVEERPTRAGRLENEIRRGGGGGGGGRGAGRGRGGQAQYENKRLRSQSRSGRDDSRGRERNQHTFGISVDVSGAPPPYTEEPLPYHSNTHGIGSLPQYGYEPMVGAPGAKEEDTFAKLKRLEQEMALVEAKKKMQEATDLMKVAAGLGELVNSSAKMSNSGGHGVGHVGPDDYQGDHQGSGTRQSQHYKPYRGRRGGRARGREGHYDMFSSWN